MVVMAFSACSLKEDDTFDEQASLRSEAHIAEVQKMLYTAPNGWLMEYYGALGFGGYNVMVKFDGTNATFASEKWGPSHKAGIGEDGKCVTTTSHFKLEQSSRSTTITRLSTITRCLTTPTTIMTRTRACMATSSSV